MSHASTKRSAAILFIIFFITISSCTGFSPTEPKAGPGGDWEQTGSVTAELRNWNWFFTMSAEERIEALEQLAEEKARAQYGENIYVVTERISGKWNPASLLMFFSTIGFVEDSEIEASVWKKLPEKAAEEPLVYGYRYIVIPEDDYSGDWGFMQVEYKTRAQLIEILNQSLCSGEITAQTFDHRMERLPDTGKIFITLAREEITNAISRWFTFSCTWNGKTVFKKRGIEDIPYVYGTDKLWWNDMSYNIGPAWDGELLLRIEDSFRDEVFNFKVVKERYVIE